MSEPQDVARELLTVLEEIQGRLTTLLGYCSACGHSAWVERGHTECGHAEVHPNDPVLCCVCGCLRSVCEQGCSHHR